MSTPMHTPGPWSWNEEHNMIESHDAFIAKVATGFNSDEDRANALLLAEAPELLEVAKSTEVALLLLIGQTPNYVDVSAPLRVVDRIRAAIAKAEGRTL